VAAEIPDSHLLVVPYTGHSVLTEEQTSCASEALQALFAAKAVKPCRPAPPPASLRPAPLPPERLRAIAPAGGYSGAPGRTLHAVTLTLQDFIRQLTLQLAFTGAEDTPLAALRTGGLRAGWGGFAGDVLTLHGYSYVPGVTVSGSIAAGAVDLSVSGSAAAHGTLRLGPRHALVGTLGGLHVLLPASSTATAAIVGDDAQASHHPGAGSAASADARKLAGLLGSFQP
jgi:hypothetical protein